MYLDGIKKEFLVGEETLMILDDVHLEAKKGDSLAIIGPSGSGKSTLLHLIGTLDQPTSGVLKLGDTEPQKLSEKELAAFRNQHIGFVFQDHHLLPQYSVLENVVLPTMAFGKGGDRQRAEELLERVGLSHRLDHRPTQLSGGERQRVAIARALINKPDYLLCDEPTGNLDQKTAETVSNLLFELHQEEQNIMILVTHAPALAEKCARVLEIQAGKLMTAGVS